jgi:hypothetical protein
MQKHSIMVIRQIFYFSIRIVLMTIALFLSFVISAVITSHGGTGESQEPAEQTVLILLGMCFMNSLVLTHPIRRSRWHGLKLTVAVFLVYFGITTFMSQIETLLFRNSIGISVGAVRDIIVQGFVCALLFAPLAVIIQGRMKRKTELREAAFKFVIIWKGWIWRLTILSIAYVVLYYLFGYFVAWQSPDIREFYSGSTEMTTFPGHISDTFHNNPGVLLIQLVRGLLWTGLALLIIRMMKGKTLEVSLVIGLLFGLLLTTGLFIPNPYMPESVRLVHFFETSISTFIFGCISGWILTGDF